MNKVRRRVRITILLGLAAAIGGCSALDMGPEPSNYVGPVSGGGGKSLTDPNLQAVTPEVSGTTPPDATNIPPVMRTIPETMPAATEPTTTQPTSSTNPAAHAALGQGNSAPTPELVPALTDVPQELSLQDAILVGLQNNTGLHIDRYNVPISRTQEEDARAAFDPHVAGSISGGRTASGPTRKGPTNNSDSVNGTASVTEVLPTGTKIVGSLSSNNSFYSDSSSKVDAGLSVTQSLLRGAGLDVNLASLRQSELGTKISQYELRGFAEQVVANIETTYWNLAFAERQVVIVQNSLDLAQALLDQTNELIRVERSAESERASAEAQVALQRENLINAKSTLEKTRLTLMQLLTPGGQPFWNRTITIKTLPFIPKGEMDSVEKHVEVALRLRPEINEAKLEIQQNDLSVVVTKNGLLPQLDFFVNLDKTSESANVGRSVTELNGHDYSAMAGITGSFDPINRAERADYRRAVLTREQSEESLRNQAQLVQLGVRTQYIEVERTRQQIDATRATRIAQQEALRLETEKYKAGRSTALAVSQQQNALLTDQLDEVLAVTGHLNALVELYRVEGSLLYRRGLKAPGGEPVQEAAWRH